MQNLVIAHISSRGAKAAWFRQVQPIGSVRRSHFDSPSTGSTTCSGRRLSAMPSDWRNESDLHLHLAQVQVSDFYALRQGFQPAKSDDAKIWAITSAK